ncbi:hypothetical protein KY362_07070 [Candidatus Woesearchaeota archaeon]|nr:hypothetical protein [Candidatus Woesearchaeota archaeon]
MVHLELPKDVKIDEMLESFQDHFAELKEEASALRKTGVDTSMADILMVDVMPKIKLARATYEQSDVESVRGMLAKIRHELDVAKDGTDFDFVLEKIQKACECIRQGRYGEASEHYAEVRKLYAKLPEDLKQIVFGISLKIHKDLAENGRRRD